jgi:peroxiredoxin
MPRPEIGDPAPDVTVIDTRGKQVSLSAFWKDRPAVAVFLRHYG